ncbi:hypothetical protein KI387_042019, partial [Taxus chinensis]
VIMKLKIANDPTAISSAVPGDVHMEKISKRLEALEADMKLLKDAVKNLANKK